MKPKETIKAKVLSYFKTTGHNLDNAKAMAMFGYFRLPVAVQSLRKQGHVIRTETFKGPEGNTMSFYTYRGELKEGTPVVITTGRYAGIKGTVARVDSVGLVGVILRSFEWVMWFEQSELDILQ